MFTSLLNKKRLAGLVLSFFLVGCSQTLSQDDKGVNNNHTQAFSFVVIPDTQYMVMDFSYFGSDFAQYTAQTKWVKENQDKLNIKFVAHVGDVVDHSDRQNEWDDFKQGWQDIESSGIPWAIAAGNHDTNLPMGEGNWDKFDQEFPYTELSKKPWFVDAYPSKSYHNNLSFFNAAGMEFMVLSIAFNMKEDTYKWAQQQLEKYPNKRAIISTHDVLAGDFKTLAAQSSNVFMIVSGHHCIDGGIGEWHNQFKNKAGLVVHELMSDYQCGGNGWLRYYTFKPAENTIKAITYKPLTNEYKEAVSSSFTWPYLMK